MHTQESTESPLTQVVTELDAELARHSWGQPVRLFALVDTDDLIAEEPQLAEALKLVPGTITSVEQDGFDQAAEVEQLLVTIGWPESVLGAAVAVERLLLPAQVEAELTDTTDPSQLSQAAAAHEARVDVRVITAVTRDGGEITMLRLGAPHDYTVTGRPGERLAPELTDLLHGTFAPDHPDSTPQ